MRTRSRLFWDVGVATSRLFKRNTAVRNAATCRFKSTTPDATVPVTKIPLDVPVPNLPKPVYAAVSHKVQETKVTTLSNGLKVASEERFGEFCTVGVLLNSGSRYEVAYPSGVSHFLEKLAFNSTQNYKDRDEIFQELEKHGGICDCQGSRDTLIYAASAYAKSVDPVMKILADVVLRPKISDEEMEYAKMAISYELQDLNMRPDQDPIMLELIHSAAYSQNTLGLPKLCPQENVSHITRNHVYQYLRSHHTPSRMVVAGVGLPHEALVEATQKYFVEKPAVWEENPDLCIPGRKAEVDSSVSQYTGGLLKVEKDLSNVSLGPTPMPELVHTMIGLESCGHQHRNFIPFCVLNTLMGGGGSFSAGGPGKGMYTRLYTSVLNRYPWMHSCTSFNHAWGDSGVFCIQASSHPSQIDDLVRLTVRELVQTSGPIGKSELERAKTQLQSMLLMNLESRPVVFEDIGRQVLSTGHRHQPQYFIDLIQKVTAEDLQRVASDMLRSKPAVAALGDVRRLPSLKDIQMGLLDKAGSLPRRSRFSLFR